jgi:hypothetical protein
MGPKTKTRLSAFEFEKVSDLKLFPMVQIQWQNCKKTRADVVEKDSSL